MLKRWSIILPVVFRLGLVNVATVALYRVAIRCGLLEKLLPRGMGYREALFPASSEPLPKPQEIPSGDAVVQVAEREGILIQHLDGRRHFRFRLNHRNEPRVDVSSHDCDR